MKKLFFWIALLAYMPIISSAQSTGSNITFPGSGIVATEEWVQNYLFDQLEKYNISNCDLKIINPLQDGNDIQFQLQTSLQNINRYSVRITKNNQQIAFYNAIPYQSGETMRLTNVPQIDSVRITVRPTAQPTCYAYLNYNLGGGGNVPDPGTGISPCDTGPILLSISTPTALNLTAQFHGVGVTKIAWKILSGVNVVRTGEVTPTSAYVPISYPAIDPGNYTLQFNGVLCTGSSTLSFTVASSVPETPDPDPTDIQPVVIFDGLKNVMNISITGTSNNWIITDNATYPLDSDKTWWYFINGEIIKQRTPLTNYPYQTNAPGRVLKMALKTGYDSFNKWAEPETYYYDPNAGQTFSQNTSSTYSTFTFR